MVHRASDESPVSRAFVDSLFRNVGGAATVLVAREGKVLVDQAYGVPDHPRYMPGTTVPNFPLGRVSDPINALVAQLAAADGKLASGAQPTPGIISKSVGSTDPMYVTRRVFTPIGAHKTTVDSTGAFASNVDELYRLSLGLDNPRAFMTETGAVSQRDDALGWESDTWRGLRRLSAFGDATGHRNAFVRIPDRHVSVIILTDRNDLNARELSERIVERLAP